MALLYHITTDLFAQLSGAWNRLVSRGYNMKSQGRHDTPESIYPPATLSYLRLFRDPSTDTGRVLVSGQSQATDGVPEWTLATVGRTCKTPDA